MAMLSAGGTIVEANSRACQMLGYPETALLDKKWTELVHPDDLPQEECDFKRLLDGLGRGYVKELRLVGRDGKAVCTSLSVQQLRKADGLIDCILVLIQDMPDKRRPLGRLLDEPLKNARI